MFISLGLYCLLLKCLHTAGYLENVFHLRLRFVCQTQMCFSAA